MARKVAAIHTQYFDDNFALHTLRPGDTLPKGHEKFVKNPKVFAEVADAEPEETDNAPKALADLSKSELVELAKERGIPHARKNADQLRVDLAEADPAPDTGDGEEEGEPDDLADASREQLERLATEADIPFDENTSDDELVALIENAKG